ncbi:hypothetical protein [Azomonas macrocytogenes]|uniref:Uncharacterized protein n=1 Tax=Azomonas macrocytogenes TaxID=69962 RepID=A0A839T6G4_AZOMA|nr:hypothetical protein [Azomonas macrocytogenes]MBB3103535.1 hypothetical protein [Azomonas macrocytogenes]
MEQLERARRYLDRLRSLYSGIFTTSADRDLYEDDAISFFMHCYYVRDWIIHLNKVGITASQVDEFINSHNELKICTDLCNGSKHCRLERNIRSGRQPHIAAKRYDTSTWLTGSGGGNVVKGRYTVVTASGTIDALDLAERCIEPPRGGLILRVISDWIGFYNHQHPLQNN